MRLFSGQTYRLAHSFLSRHPSVLSPRRFSSSPPGPDPAAPLGKRQHLFDRLLVDSVKGLEDFLDHLIPATEREKDWLLNPSRSLPKTSFLAFFPPRGTIAVDGGVLSHVPGVKLARDWDAWDRPRHPDLGWKRLWKGGKVEFKKPLTLHGKSTWHCRERVYIPQEAVSAPADESTTARTKEVDVERLYSHPNDFQKAAAWELRKLAFVPGNVDPVASAGGRIIKARHAATDTYEFQPDAQDLADFSDITHNQHFIHLHPTRSLVQGNLMLAAMLRVLDTLIATWYPDRRVKPDGLTAQARLQGITYTILRPALVGQKLKVCVKRAKSELDGDIADLVDDETQMPLFQIGHKVDVDWPIWIEAEDGGMVVKATARLTLKNAGLYTERRQRPSRRGGNLQME